MSSSTSQKKYDVFISFRGQDTRETFTSHLHYALCKQNIITYIDDNLVKGDEIGPALSQAIQDSRISLIIFSKNYATSKWCLNELLKILECRKLHGQMVIPVFYNIDPSDVRKQTGSYGEAFAKYEREVNNESFANTVSQWRKALAEAANIPGWDSQSRTHKDDSQVIHSIVNDVWQKLALLYPNQLKGLVHNDEHSKYAESLLKIYPRIGIWGMGGIGKTTTARQMFFNHYAQYDSACFLENVSEEVEKFGLRYIRNKLFSVLLKKEITASDILGATFIKRMFSGRKVFIVLDDVGNSAQLEYLCEELDDLGPNSRLIFTARDRHTLRGKVDEIYKVPEWKFEESLRLFSLGAFKQNHPEEGYKLLSQRAVAYAGGVPLALKVLGSHFYSRSREFWEPELKNLENKGESLRGIQEVLKVSYNGLTVREKEIFLDIAFFFKDENSDLVTSILDAGGFNAKSGIDMLEDKALISISYGSKIQMHDLLQKMAFDIVRQKENSTSRDPGKRSRLRDIEEVCDLFKNSKGTHKVEGIMFDLSQKGDLHVQADTFNKMTKLKFLRLYVPLRKKRLATIYHPKDMLPFSDKLIYLEWNEYPWKCLPHPFCAELLVKIYLPHSNVEYLWHGIQELVNLEMIHLRESKQLTKLPDLSRATKLKYLNLSGCESLREVHLSKDALVTLLVDRCKNLESLVSEKHLTSLQMLNISGCSSLSEFSLSWDLIEDLNLSNTSIEILHSSIGRLRNLRTLDLQGLRLKNLPKEMSCLRSLTKLELSNCDIVNKSNLEAIFDGLESLERLYLKDCGNLLELPMNIDSLSSLYELRLDGSNVKILPTSIKNLSSLQILSLNNCKKLGYLPELPPHIREFKAENCISLGKVSSLKGLSQSMMGEQKYISFKNSMKLDAPSFDHIMEDFILTMKSAAFHNTIITFEDDCNVHNSAHVCLPGHRVPRQFKFRTIASSSSITIEFPHPSKSFGLIFSVVVSSSYRMKEYHDDYIQCQYYSEDGSQKFSNCPIMLDREITDLSLDHIFLWLSPLSCVFDNTTVFEFCVITDSWEHNDAYSLKECGICPIYYSELPRIAATVNLSRDLESVIASELSEMFGSDLNESMQFESESIERYVDNDDERELGNDIDESIEICDKKESTCIQKNQQDSDLNEKCSYSSYDRLMGPLRYLWRLSAPRR